MIYTTDVDTKIATIEHRSIIAKQQSTNAWNQENTIYTTEVDTKI